MLQFGFVNAAESGASNVLGPAVAKAHLGGAGGWGAVLAADSIGVIVCGAIMLRWRPGRMLLVATLAVFPFVLPLVALIGPSPLVVVIAAAFAAGFSIEIFGVLWDTAIQQEIPQEKLSRVSSYDALGSWVLMPVGFVVVGPIASAVGTRATFLGCAALIVASTAAVLLSRDVRMITRRSEAGPSTAST